MIPLLFVSLYVIAQYCSSLSERVTPWKKILTLIDVLLDFISSISPFSRFRSIISAVFEKSMSNFFDIDDAESSDSVSDNQLLNEVVSLKLEALECELNELRAAHENFLVDTRARFERSVNAFLTDLRMTHAKELDSLIPPVIPPSEEDDKISLKVLESVWRKRSSCESFVCKNPLVDCLLEEILELPRNFMIRAGESNTPTNSLLLRMLSCSLDHLIEGEYMEISSLNRFDRLLSVIHADTKLSGHIALTVAPLATLFCMSELSDSIETVLNSEMNKMTEEAKSAIFVIRSCMEISNHSSGELSLSNLNEEALLCLDTKSFAKFLGERTFYKKNDLSTLLKRKLLIQDDFPYLNYLEISSLPASALQDCEALLDPETYATLLTQVLANIEEENRNLSKLKLAEEISGGDRVERSEARRIFRYSVN